MYYPEELVEEVRVRNDIVDVVSGYVRLQKKGANHWGCCPFHNEKTPSFAVNGAKQMYHCFGCGAGGDVITFIRLIENLDYIESVKFLAQRGWRPGRGSACRRRSMMRSRSRGRITGSSFWT